MPFPRSISTKQGMPRFAGHRKDKLLNIFRSESKLSDHVWWICAE